MPKLFKKFDRDGNGELEIEEFCATRLGTLGDVGGLGVKGLRGLGSRGFGVYMGFRVSGLGFN